MKSIIPRPTRDGGILIAELPKGTTIRRWGDGFIAVHPDHQPMIINPDGTTEVLKAER